MLSGKLNLYIYKMQIMVIYSSIAFDNKLDHMDREKINNITDYTVRLI